MSKTACGLLLEGNLDNQDGVLVGLLCSHLLVGRNLIGLHARALLTHVLQPPGLEKMRAPVVRAVQRLVAAPQNLHRGPKTRHRDGEDSGVVVDRLIVKKLHTELCGLIGLSDRENTTLGAHKRVRVALLHEESKLLEVRVQRSYRVVHHKSEGAHGNVVRVVLQVRGGADHRHEQGHEQAVAALVD